MPEQEPLKLKVLRPESLGDQSLKALRHIRDKGEKYRNDLSDTGRRFFDKVIRGVYEDCLKAGRKEEADAILGPQGIPEIFKKVQNQQPVPELPQEGLLGPVVFYEEE